MALRSNPSGSNAPPIQASTPSYSSWGGVPNRGQELLAAWRATDIIGRSGAGAGGAERIAPIGIESRQWLDRDPKAPAVTGVVFVGELANAIAEQRLESVLSFVERVELSEVVQHNAAGRAAAGPCQCPSLVPHKTLVADDAVVLMDDDDRCEPLLLVRQSPRFQLMVEDRVSAREPGDIVRRRQRLRKRKRHGKRPPLSRPSGLPSRTRGGSISPLADCLSAPAPRELPLERGNLQSKRRIFGARLAPVPPEIHGETGKGHHEQPGHTPSDPPLDRWAAATGG